MGDLDALVDMDLTKLRAICRNVLADEEQPEHKEQEQPEKQEANKQAKSESAESGITPANTPAFVFVGTHDTKWPKSTGVSLREKQLAQRKEQ